MDFEREKEWAMFTHLISLAGFLIPFGNIIGPLILWIMKKDESSFVNEHGKEAVNFQITMTILAIIFAVLSLLCIGIFLLLIETIFILICVIWASIEANNGRYFKYPLSIKFLK